MALLVASYRSSDWPAVKGVEQDGKMDDRPGYYVSALANPRGRVPVAPDAPYYRLRNQTYYYANHMMWMDARASHRFLPAKEGWNNWGNVFSKWKARMIALCNPEA
jgi:hypothetical protein